MSKVKIRYESNNAELAGVVDTDEIGEVIVETKDLVEALAANTDFRAALKTYFDTVYEPKA